MTEEPPTGGSDRAEAPIDLQQLVRDAVATPPGHAQGGQAGMTSDLSIDEELTLHTVGWEPVELVCGASLHSVPVGVWNWGQGEITSASGAYGSSFAAAAERIHRECAKAGGHGVVGVHVEGGIERHHIDVVLTGTAVRPVGAKRIAAESVFVSDLSGRDFALLRASGWAPVGLAAGASFVYAPRRSAGVAMRQTSQNVELTNYTEAMYAAREAAMERMQQSALRMGGSGVTGVTMDEGPMHFAGHAVGFTVYGTVVRLEAEQHRNLGPIMVLPLDDQVVAFEAASLRGS